MNTRMTFILLLVMFGCKKDDPVSSTSNVFSGTVDISVSTGTTPTFNWSPSVSLFLLLVELDSSGADQWSVISDSTNAISPPVTYGVVPPGARQPHSPNALTLGVAYKVILFQWTGPGRQDGKQVGRRTFTP
jgi:hypothetical protein